MKTAFVELCKHGCRYVAGCYIEDCPGGREIKLREVYMEGYGKTVFVEVTE